MENNVLSDNEDVDSINTSDGNNNHNNKTENEIEKSEYYDPTKNNVNNYLKGDTTMYDNYGKYFDSYLFNKKFDKYIDKESNERFLDNEIKTNDLDSLANMKINPYELPISKIMVNIKNMWFNIFDDIIELKNPFSIINDDNIFYMAISLISIALVYLFLYMLFS